MRCTVLYKKEKKKVTPIWQSFTSPSHPLPLASWHLADLFFPKQIAFKVYILHYLGIKPMTLFFNDSVSCFATIFFLSSGHILLCIMEKTTKSSIHDHVIWIWFNYTDVKAFSICPISSDILPVASIFMPYYGDMQF